MQINCNSVVQLLKAVVQAMHTNARSGAANDAYEVDEVRGAAADAVAS